MSQQAFREMVACGLCIRNGKEADARGKEVCGNPGGIFVQISTPVPGRTSGADEVVLPGSVVVFISIGYSRSGLLLVRLLLLFPKFGRRKRTFSRYVTLCNS